MAYLNDVWSIALDVTESPSPPPPEQKKFVIIQIGSEAYLKKIIIKDFILTQNTNALDNIITVERV